MRAELVEPAIGHVAIDGDEIRRVGDNRGSMLLKGATPDHEGEPRPDRWGLDEELEQVARRWAIDPVRDLRAASAVVARAR